MKRFITLTLYLAVTIMMAAPLDEVIKFYSGVKSMKGKFEQKFCEASSGTCILTSGNFYFAEPDKMRIEIKTPYVQYMVSDGETAIIYDVASNVAIKMPAQQGAYAFGLVDLVKQFNEYYKIENTRKEGKLTVYKLLPKNDELKSEVDSILVAVNSKNRIKRLSYYDTMGNESELRLMNVKYNVKISGEKFHLKLPEDVKMVDQTQG